MFRLLRALIVWVLVLVALAGCGGSASDKAGGQASDAVVLTLADGETDFSNAQPFANAVKRLSHGRLVIRIETRWKDSVLRYETALIKDVETGNAQLGITASRAFDTVGIDSFQALQAPFLVNSLTLEEHVLASNIPEKMLGGLRQAGLVGLAILPGPLRRPLGFIKPLLSVSDYRRARIGIRASTVTEATLHALGATAIVLPANNYTSARLDGVEGQLWYLDSTFGERGTTVTGNVNFEPRPNVIFINRHAFDPLSSAERAILVRAATEARISGGVFQPDDGSAQDLCRRGTKIIAASTRDLAGLRAAVQPVYRELESNPSTKAFIGEIVAMRQATGGTPDAASCSASQQARGVAVSATELQGTWQVTFNRSELKAAGAYPDEDLPGNYGHFTFTFDRGHFLQVGPRAGPGSGPASGTFVVNGDQITFHRSDHAYPGSDTEIWGPYRWSAYRDTLTFKKSGPGPMPTGLVVKAWRRSADSG